MRKYFSILIALLFAFSVAACGSSSSSKQSSSNSSAPKATEQQTQKETPKANKAPEWNKSDINAESNGNLAIAASIVREKKGSLKENAETINPADAIKRPWDYYGKVYKFQGIAYVLQDYPPTSDMGKALGGDACEIVITSGESETIVDGMLYGTTKGIQEGTTVNMYGYIVGTMEVPNKIGGKFTHLVVVGVK